MFDGERLWQRIDPIILASEVPTIGRDWIVNLPPTPEGVYYRPKSMRFRLAASAAAPARNVAIEYARGDGITYMRCYGGVNVGPNITSDQSWLELPTNGQVSRGGTPTPAEHQFALPYDFRIPGNDRIRSQTVNLDAADQYSAAIVLCDRYIYRTVPAVSKHGVVSLDDESIDKLVAAALATLPRPVAIP